MFAPVIGMIVTSSVGCNDLALAARQTRGQQLLKNLAFPEILVWTSIVASEYSTWIGPLGRRDYWSPNLLHFPSTPENNTMPQTIPQEVDVAVIGGGPAGATTSTLIAQQGHNVHLFEREHFPRFHIGESL